MAKRKAKYCFSIPDTTWNQLGIRCSQALVVPVPPELMQMFEEHGERFMGYVRNRVEFLGNEGTKVLGTIPAKFHPESDYAYQYRFDRGDSCINVMRRRRHRPENWKRVLFNDDLESSVLREFAEQEVRERDIKLVEKIIQNATDEEIEHYWECYDLMRYRPGNEDHFDEGVDKQGELEDELFNKYWN